VDFFIVNFEFEIQGCEMICSQTQNPNLGTFLRALYWKMLTYFLAIGNIFWRFGIFYDHSVQFAFIWYIFRFWQHAPRKIWQPWLEYRMKKTCLLKARLVATSLESKNMKETNGGRKKMFHAICPQAEKSVFPVQVLRKQDCIYKILTLNNYE
jgi:hypothetical protein